MTEERKKLTVPDLMARKRAGEKVVMASIPDYPTAVWAERAGIDICAVGDSLGMVSYGHAHTLPVTVDLSRPLTELVHDAVAQIESQYIRKALTKTHGHIGR